MAYWIRGFQPLLPKPGSFCENEETYCKILGICKIRWRRNGVKLSKNGENWNCLISHFYVIGVDTPRPNDWVEYLSVWTKRKELRHRRACAIIKMTPDWCTLHEVGGSLASVWHYNTVKKYKIVLIKKSFFYCAGWFSSLCRFSILVAMLIPPTLSLASNATLNLTIIPGFSFRLS